MKLLLPLFAPLLAAASAWGLESSAPLTPEQTDFFEKKIRPVLADKCYKCHSDQAKKVKGGLLLDNREATRRGGDDGPAVVPGNLQDSLLIQAIRYADKDTAMPPQKSGGKLPDAVIKDFEAWVKMGAPDPRDGAAKVVKSYDTEAAKKWWSFQPVQRPAVPEVRDAAWSKGLIDQFVLAGLEAKGLKPVGDADRLTLLRRAYFDLTGLPPTTQEIDAFMHDQAGDAFPRVVDRLLASPQFGERWGRHWLDVARYAESSGKDVNIAYPQAWRYRDYVIASFNADKPYDQFIREQIAGDLLPAKDDRRRAEQLVATGFLAIGTKSHNEGNPRQFALDVADEQIDAVSQSVLGLTVACARCHDHKFDPIAQREYYGLAGIFLSTETRYGTAGGAQNRHPSDLLELPRGSGAPILEKPISPEELARKQAQAESLRTEARELVAERAKARFQAKKEVANGMTPAEDARRKLRPLVVATELGAVEAELKAYDAQGQPKALAMGVQDQPLDAPAGAPRGGGRLRLGLGYGKAAQGGIADSPLYVRGEVAQPGEKVPRGFPALLTSSSTPPVDRRTSGRRELAEWLVTPQNPLTQRVLANRVWHWLFGQGLVGSTDNFGTMGKPPSNPALLDFLATRLVTGGWSVKQLVREIVLSRTYQLASTFDEKNFAADSENALLWRASKRRLDAECIRDAMLRAAGNLDLRPPTGSLIAEYGDGPIAGKRRGLGEDSLVNAGGVQRSVYLPIARDLLPDALAVFDFAEPSLVTGARETTNVPSQALYLLNNPFATEQAARVAYRVLGTLPGGPYPSATENLEKRLNFAYYLTLSRPPNPAERQAAAAFFSKFPAEAGKTPQEAPAPGGFKSPAQIQAAWTSLCRALFAGAEFRYLN